MQSQFAASQAKSKYLHVHFREERECCLVFNIMGKILHGVPLIFKMLSVFIMSKINWRNMAALRIADEGHIECA